MTRTLLALLPLILLGGLARGRRHLRQYVLGDDFRDGSSSEVLGRLSGPCRSISKALKLVRPGERVVLAKTDQPYRESITLQAATHSGSPRQPFELVGNGAVLDGTRVVSDDVWEHVEGDVFRFQPPRMSFQILYLGAKPAIQKPVQTGSGLPELSPLEWCLYQRHIYFRVEPGKLPRHYELFHTYLTVGITLYETRHVVIRDLIVQGFQLDGVNAHDNVFDATIQGLTSRGNGRSGVSIGGASRVTLVDCVVGDNGAAQVRTEGFCKAEIIHCELLENTAPGLVREGGEVLVRAVEAK